MIKLRIQTENIAGFTAEDVAEGDRVHLIEMDALTSDHPRFYLYVSQLTDIYLSRIGGPVNSVSKFLVVHHPDNTADVFVNDFPELISVRVNRDMRAGEEIYKKDISDIQKVAFPGVEIDASDAVVYCAKINWKFGLFFDFRRKLDVEEMGRAIGKLHKDLEFENYLARTEAGINAAKADDLRKNIEHSVFVITEGKTDWKHIKNATDGLGAGRDCTVLEFEDDRGDDVALRMCEYFATVPQKDRYIFIFDRDNPRIIGRLNGMTIDGEEFQRWGNNVFSFMIPIPPHRSGFEHISIEFYYTDEEIRTRDGSGKRLHFSNELKKEILPGNVVRKIEIEPDAALELTKRIDADDASKIFDADGRAVGLSKSAFAENILAREKGFDGFGLEPFRAIIGMIEKISKLD